MARKTQEEIDARIAELGGEKLAHGLVGKKTIKNPAALANGGNDEDAPATFDVDVEQWKSPGGEILQAYHMPDGSWETVKDTPPTKPTGTTAPPTRNLMQPDGKVHVMERAADGSYSVDRGLAASQPTTPGENQYRPPQHIQQADGKTHVMGYNPDTKKWDIDQGLAPPTAVAAKPPPSDTSKWQPLKGPDGKVVALLDPATGDTVSVTQKSATTVETKEGRIVSISADGTTATDITPAGIGTKNAPLPAGVPRYVPDPNDPAGDFGLSAYDAALRDAQAKKLIDRQQGADLMAEAGNTAQVAERRYTNDVTARSNQRTQDVTQRGQDVNEVASRRGDAGKVFDDAFKNYSSTMLPNGSGGIAVDAFRAALNDGRRNAEDSGGMRDVAPIPPAYERARHTKISPDGTITIKHTEPAADPAAASTPTAPAAVQGTPSDVGDTGAPAVPAQSDQGGGASTPVNPAEGQPGHDPTKPVGETPIPPGYEMARQSVPEWSPHPNTIADLKAKGFSDDEIHEALGRMVVNA